MFEENPFTKPHIASLWIEFIENLNGELRDLHIYPSLQKWEEDLGEGAVLEIGCGQGICSSRLSGLHQYIGVEPSEWLLKRAIQKYGTSNRNFLQGSAYSLPISEGSCTGVFSICVWMHLANLNLAASELSRTLKVGGKFLIVTVNPNSFELWENMHFNATKFSDRITGGLHLVGTDLPEHVLFTHKQEDNIQSLSENGLTVLSTESYGRASINDKDDWFLEIRGVKR